MSDGEKSNPLVWLPFSVDHIEGAPAGLRYESWLVEDGDELPGWLEEVEFYVPAYMSPVPHADLIARMPALKVVQTLTAGVDDIRSAVPAGVTLCNGRGIHNASTAELAVTLTLASLRGIPDFVRTQDTGTWRPKVLPSLADRSVLIVGYGEIGAAIEARLAGFECEVVRVARTPRLGVHGLAELPALLPEADVVILIVPITDETRGMVDAGFLARMRDGALLVNVARGAVVDTGALVEALATGRISAALDVTDPEPLPEGHPLWAAPNLLLTPHVGGASSAMWPRAYRVVREQLERFATGQPLANVMDGPY
ncbi:MAG TPA: 2-hydroxyacid dehydrogenase [Nocardioidaceae bacterium]|nr:2-hydroxyacid dehydrogenase [Nocardioidaceae bacterium]